MFVHLLYGIYVWGVNFNVHLYEFGVCSKIIMNILQMICGRSRVYELSLVDVFSVPVVCNVYDHPSTVPIKMFMYIVAF